MDFFTKFSAKPIHIPAEWLELLLEARAGETSHSGGRTLLDHCVGVYGLMKWISFSESAARAGLVHSIYSTDSFETQCLPLEARPRVAEVLGERAEFLAYCFCAMDRGEFVFTPPVPGEYSLYDRFEKKTLALAKDEYYDLVDLLFANELEQLHPRSHGVMGRDDGSEPTIRSLLRNVSKEAIILYDRLFRHNQPPPTSSTPDDTPVPPLWESRHRPLKDDPSTWYPRFSDLFLARVPQPLISAVQSRLAGEGTSGGEGSSSSSNGHALLQADLFTQILDPSLEHCENDFWDLWITLVSPKTGERISLALPPEADYDLLQTALCSALGLDPQAEAVLGLTERGSGPVLSLEFLSSDYLWLLIPEHVYGVATVPATERSLAAAGLETGGAVPVPLDSLIPPHFSLAELRAEMFVPNSPLVAAFAAAGAKYGSLALTLSEAEVALIHGAIAKGDAFFDLPYEAKTATSVEFDDNKFAGFASNRFRDWFQVRSVYTADAVESIYMGQRDLSQALLRLWLLLEAIARDVVVLLCFGIGLDPERILSMCDAPGLPPVMHGVLEEGEHGTLLDASMLSAYDARVHPQPQPDPSSSVPSGSVDVETRSEPWKRKPWLKDYPGSNVMRFFRYHTGKTDEDREKFKSSYPSSPHADLGLVTVAPVSPNPALEVQSHLTEGMVLVEEKLRPVEDVTIMLGENLGYITRGHFRAPFHRVIPNYETTRYSMPFFLRAHPLAESDPARICTGIDALPQTPIASSIEPTPPYLVHEVMDLVVQSRPLGIPEYTDY